MELDLCSLSRGESTALLLRERLEKQGYHCYRMGRFEEYSLYQQYARFLSTEQVITFTDLDGRLLAVKPDVTLSIAKNAQPQPGQCKKYYYQEKVYRPSRESHTFREISQMGVECIGAVDNSLVTQIIRLGIDALALTGCDFVLEVGHMGFITGLLEGLQVPPEIRGAVLECLRNKQGHILAEYARQGKLSHDCAATLQRVILLEGELGPVLDQAQAMVLNTKMQAALDQLEDIAGILGHISQKVRLSLRLTGEMEYYNGVVMAGYVKGLPRCLLKGGQYDLLARQFTPGAGAMGFALYLDELDGLKESDDTSPEEPVVLNVALPKGRLGDKVYALMEKIGYGCPEDYQDSRKLVVENPQAGIRYFLVKPSDVAVYVEHGAADIGIVGKDILVESGADVDELLDTGLGKCRMCVAGPKDFQEDESRPLRVATKFVNIAKDHFAGKGRVIDIIKLNGSIELAPILGLSDVIVDIVETGTTLKENDLAVLEEFMPISARVIANKSTSKFKETQLKTLLAKLGEVLKHD